MTLKVRDNIVNNIRKVPYLSTLDTIEVPSPLKDGFIHSHQTFPDGGICLEFGVGQGNSWMWQVLQILNRYPNDVLIGFDSWQGLPEETPGVWAPNRHNKGAFASPKENVIRRMEEMGASLGSQFKLVDGFFSESFTDELRDKIDNLIFVNIDVDIHSSTMQVLRWIRPLLQPGTVIYFDDWLDPIDIGKGAPKWGEHLAFEEWSRENPSFKFESIALNDVNQRAFQVTS
ncbi:MAG: hypothetical protein UX34_C0032G0007 [Candidatus Woesebacteria bacterium GW2011_GWF1_46_13]|uniref:Uncharacterized protein n=2 Tax=Candidatus Woeseibacteriota TaxID=1752722 RepID=A0A0G1QWM7_9BACT|nr:MAG: hypothetical protein UX34_C0032G0007 [Candidatus Woesebacteria bacterium GW2011_GWF1_46_13]OGM77761.1 MAG: hypothetical protein A2197_01680 [Candidatus Woesebacteria bacterium RIFOXYA1_FULL_48_16]